MIGVNEKLNAMSQRCSLLAMAMAEQDQKQIGCRDSAVEEVLLASGGTHNN